MRGLVSFLGVDAFIPIRILFALIFIVILLTLITATGRFRGKYQNPYLSNITDLP